jgi:hypothetical protein
MTWYKVWVIVSAGPSEPEYLELPDFREDYEMRNYIVEECWQFAWVNSAETYSIKYEKVDYLPDDLIEQKIKHQKYIIENAVKDAEKRIIELEKLRKPKTS